MHEDRPYELLKEMAAKHVMVEINLTKQRRNPRRARAKTIPYPSIANTAFPWRSPTDDERSLAHRYDA